MTRIENGVSLEQIDQAFKNAEDMDGMISPITLDSILKVVCGYYKISPLAVVKKTRIKEVRQTRQIIMFFANKYIKTSNRLIGEQLGGFNPATIIHAREAVNNMYDTEKQFKFQIKEIDKFLNKYYKIYTPCTHTKLIIKV